MLDEKTLESINKGITQTIEKSLPEIVNETVSSKISELESKSAKEMTEIKAELKKLSLQGKSFNANAQTFAKKTAIVSIVKEVLQNKVTSEKGFNDVVARTIKTMSSDVSGSGSEMVFDQFENDVLRIISTYSVVNDVKILNILK